MSTLCHYILYIYIHIYITFVIDTQHIHAGPQGAAREGTAAALRPFKTHLKKHTNLTDRNNKHTKHRQHLNEHNTAKPTARCREALHGRQGWPPRGAAPEHRARGHRQRRAPFLYVSVRHNTHTSHNIYMYMY